MSIRALVVDDYQEHLDTLVTTLQVYGCEARGAITVEDGLEIYSQFKPNLLICDGLMTGMRAWQFGYEVLRDKTTPKPYMVALTGFGSTLQRRLCEECGYDEYVQKPIDLGTLLSWVMKVRNRIEVKGVKEKEG